MKLLVRTSIAPIIFWASSASVFVQSWKELCTKSQTFSPRERTIESFAYADSAKYPSMFYSS